MIAGGILGIIVIISVVIAIIVICCKRQQKAKDRGKEGVPLKGVWKHLLEQENMVQNFTHPYDTSLLLQHYSVKNTVFH